MSNNKQKFSFRHKKKSFKTQVSNIPKGYPVGTQTTTIKMFPTLVLLQLLFLPNTRLHLAAQTIKQNKQKLNSSLSSLVTPFRLLISYTLSLSQIHSFNLRCYLNNLTGLSASIHSRVAFSTTLTVPF